MARRRRSTYAERCANMLGVALALGGLGAAAWVMHAAFVWYFKAR